MTRNVIECNFDDQLRPNGEPRRLLSAPPSAGSAGRGAGEPGRLDDRLQHFRGVAALRRAHRTDKANVV
jgi:hypothetical protein